MPRLKSIDLGLRNKLRAKSFRDEFFATLAKDEVAHQIRELREKRGLKQKDIAAVTGMTQSAVSRLEQSEYAKWSFPTLLRIASATDSRVKIIFQAAEDAVREVCETEFRTGTLEDDSVSARQHEKRENRYSGDLSQVWLSSIEQKPGLSKGVVTAAATSNAPYSRQSLSYISPLISKRNQAKGER